MCVAVGGLEVGVSVNEAVAVGMPVAAIFAVGVRVKVSVGVGVVVEAFFETTIFTKTTPPNPTPWAFASLQ